MNLRDAWLAEMWKPCRELPIGERLAKREADAVSQSLMAEMVVDAPVEMPDRKAS